MALPALGAPPAGIIGGEPAPAGAWPWQVSLGLSGRDAWSGHFCGGALVSTRLVATAAHCVVSGSTGKSIDPAALAVTLGTNDLRSGGMTVGVVRIVLNPSFDPARFDNDIALLELEREATCARCRPIGLVTPDTEAMVSAPGMPATVTGWGVTRVGADQVPALLQQAVVPVVDEATCVAGYGVDTITPRMLCAGVGNSDSCQGDSGGPLVVPDNSGTGYLLAGLVSFGQSCANASFPGVYTRMALFSEWVSAANREAVARAGSEAAGGGGSADAAWLSTVLLLRLRPLRRTSRL